MKTVLHNKYSSYLESIECISNVEVWEDGSIKFTLKLNSELYNLIFCWIDEYTLPKVLLCNTEEAPKPHYMQVKKNELFLLCLSVREDISIRNKTYKEIIDYTIIRIKRLLTMNEEEEKREFRKEFLYFWNSNSKNKNKIQLYANTSNKVKMLKSYEKKNMLTFIDDDIKLNGTFFNKYTEKSYQVLYIPLINSNIVMPPIENHKWNVNTIKEIFNNCISEENLEILEQLIVKNEDLFVVFEMYIPGVVPITFVARLNFNRNKIFKLYESLNYIASVHYYSSERCNMDHLFKRIGVMNGIADKNIIVIGVGSLGSYVVSELPKIGVKNITIVDSDTLLMENIPRHYLGAMNANYSKVVGMKFQLQANFPEVNINLKKGKFDVSSIDTYNLLQYDLIVIATGGTDYMLKLNKYFKDNNISTSVLFTWIESRGAGVHALLVDYNNKGCFNCLYEGSKNNKAHFSNSNNYNDELTGTGCGGVINKYGNIVLLKGTAMIVEVILNILQGTKCDKNLLFSVNTMNKYDDCGTYISCGGEVIASYSYISKGCDICGSGI